MCESKGVEDNVKKGAKGYKELNHVSQVHGSK